MEDATAGLNALSGGDNATAIRLFTRALQTGRLSPSDRELALVKRGQAYLGVGRRDLALRDLQQALRLQPSDQEAADLQLQARGAAPLGQAPSSVAAAPPPARYYWVGIAWNHRGGWATRPAETEAEAQSLALNACNAIAGDCYNADNPIPGDRHMCWALAQDGNNEFTSSDPDLALARNAALEQCENSGDPGPGCAIKIAACNDHP